MLFRSGNPLILVPPDTTREVRVNVVVPSTSITTNSTDIRFRITAQEDKETAIHKDFFKSP